MDCSSSNMEDARAGPSEWLEIVLPGSSTRWIINTHSADSSSRPPPGAVVRPLCDSDWIKLYDEVSRHFYYFNVKKMKTVWKRPTDGQIIHLAHKQGSINSPSNESCNESCSEVQSSNSTLPQTDSQLPVAEPSVQEQVPIRPAGSSMDRLPFRRSLLPVDSKILEQTLLSTPPIAPKKPPRIFKDFPSPSDNEGLPVPSVRSSESSPSAESQTTTEITVPQPLRRAPSPPPVHPRPSSFIKKPQIPPRTVSQNRPASLGTEEEFVRTSPLILPPVPVSDVDAIQLVPSQLPCDLVTIPLPAEVQPPPPSVPPPMPPSTSWDRSYSRKNQRMASDSTPTPTSPAEDVVKRPSSMIISPSHVISPLITKTATVSSSQTSRMVSDIMIMNKSVNLEEHRTGLWRKRKSLSTILTWSKDPIKSPIVFTTDKTVRKEAVESFKLIMKYMGDKNCKQDKNNVALDLVIKGYYIIALRDEIFIQISKQTTGNDRQASLHAGWELFAICLAVFPPSVKYINYLEGYFATSMEPTVDVNDANVQMFARHCHTQLNRISKAGARPLMKKPTVEDINNARYLVFNPSMFGSQLEDVMHMQKERFPELQVPWILHTLSALVINLNGLQTEGIFRVPGDIEAVNSFKMKVDRFEIPSDMKDPTVAASLLKFWFREMLDSVIPTSFYDMCLRDCQNPAAVLHVVSILPPINRAVIEFLVVFIQTFLSASVVAKTKMDLNNLALMWSPNILRCPLQDYRQMFINTKSEHLFTRTLLSQLHVNPADVGFHLGL